MLKKALIAIGLALQALLLLSCAPADTAEEAQYSITGTIKNLLSGEPIAGVTILAGSHEAVTDSSGNYSISIDPSEPTVDGSFAVFKGLDYTFLAIDQVSIDATDDPVLNLLLPPTDTGLPSITLSGELFYADGTTELEDGSVVALCVLNTKGGIDLAVDTNYSQAGEGYSLSSRAFGADCFVGVLVLPNGGSFFSFYLKEQDLTTNKADYELTQPATGYTSIVFNGPDGASFSGNLRVPDYGILPGFVRESFSGSTTTTVDVYNPDELSFNWTVSKMESGTPASGDTTLRVSSTALAALSSPIDLTVPSGGPTAIVEAATTAAWDGATGTLSFGSADGANGYAVDLADGSSANGSGILWMSSTSFELPAALVSEVLESGEAWDATVNSAWTPAGTDMLSLFLRIGISHYPEGAAFQLVQIMPGAGGTAADLIP
jgi:hypothetical protein